MNNSFKFIILGAGLSGLTTAYKLWQAGETRFCVLEARDRLGGRIHTQDGIDFGATWFQGHHECVLTLLKELQIPIFFQYSKGKSVLVYSSMAPAHIFESDPNAPSAYRIDGGSHAVIDALASTIVSQIRRSIQATSISETADGIAIATNQGVFRAEKVINTIPPRLSTAMVFEPSLPERLWQTMENTHTWMSNAMKVGMTFETPFWREKGHSGMMIGQVGAVTELYDHSNAAETHFTLMGFINEGLRELSAEDRKELILAYIEKQFGPEIRNYKTYEEKDWYQDRHTSCERLQSVYISPRYGNPLFQEAYMNGKLLFSGAETAMLYGGYMDGAVRSGIAASAFLLES